MIARAFLVAALILGTAVAERRVAGAEVPVSRQSLDSIPHVLDGWQGRPASALPRDVVALLGVDEHVYRTYVRGGVPLNLYAGYYDSQRQGDTVHSPQNCLPGAGWHPVRAGERDIQVGARSVRVNEYVIQKGLQQQVVLYWYQGRGRVVANEYTNKLLLMWDAARLRRSNGGLVRVIVPVTSSTDAAAAQAASFASALLPHLDRVMP